MPIDKKQKKVINIFIQLSVIAFLAVFIFQKFQNEELVISYGFFQSSFEEHIVLWLLVLLLMPLNWLLESIKWKKLCEPLFRIPLTSAIKGVVAGLSVSFITPHGWGDYVGRIMTFREPDRERLVGALLFGKMAQLFITVIFGLVGLVIYFQKWPFFYLWYIFIFLVVAIFLLFNRTFYRKLNPYFSRIKKYFSIIRKYSFKDVSAVLLLSACRYIIFTMQFIIIMLLLDVELDIFIIFSGITWIFLVKSIVPSFNFLSDLGIRQVSAIMFFESYMTDVSPVVAATFIIWIINIFVPAVIGTLFVFSIKVFR